MKNITLTKFIEKNIVLNTTIKDAKGSEEKLLLLENDGVEGGYVKFFYSAYVRPNSEITIEARPRQKAQGQNEQFLQNLIFHPKILKINIEDSCAINLPESRLEIRQGIIFQGKVNADVKDWKLNIHYDGQTPEGEQELVQSFIIQKPEFRVGPYPDFHHYKISAEKSGYRFDPEISEQGYNVYSVLFNAQKLSHLEIKIVDNKDKPISGALIFISSTSKKNFLKINNYTNDDGVFSTQNLVKGEYFIKAVLKEYVFEPAQSTLTINDGEHKKLVLRATRVAFSLFGNIKNLNKQGCEGLTVVAVPFDSNVTSENGITDKDGNYRIKGLVPRAMYRIEVEKSPKYATIKPSELIFEAKSEDIENVDFIGFERKNTYSILGNLKFEDSFSTKEIDQIEFVQLRLFKDDELLDTITLKLFKYYEFKGLKKDNYQIKVTVKKIGLNPNLEFQENISEISFDERNQAAVDILIKKENTKINETATKSSFLAPIVILIIIVLFFNLDSVSRWYKKYNEEKSLSIKKRL